MNNQATVDSNVLIALIDSHDKWHLKANGISTALEVDGVSSIYFDCVLNETISVLSRRLEEQRRSNQLPSLLDKLLREVPEQTITWISAEAQRLYSDIVQLVRQTHGALNFHDASIALSCQELGIEVIVSFDRDFDQIS
ncbi:MAG: type II toxin-antitoxin system VapC family toxin [Candidatus Poribacteria bacterium]|nr:type II toxin-antitoxin system VapC family toxin [Candidatus Poribacteria bacterium]